MRRASSSSRKQLKDWQVNLILVLTAGVLFIIVWLLMNSLLGPIFN